MSGIATGIVAAVAENGVIGDGGGMPWRLATDLRRFKALTMGRPVVMGRKTFESIGRPLPGRTNIVVSRRSGYRPEGAAAADSLEAAIEKAEGVARAAGADEIFVIGGGEIYRAAMPLADRLHITHVAARPEGDTRFPPIDPAVWAAVATEAVPAGPKDSAATIYTIYRRREDVASR